MVSPISISAYTVVRLSDLTGRERHERLRDCANRENGFPILSEKTSLVFERMLGCWLIGSAAGEFSVFTERGVEFERCCLPWGLGVLHKENMALIPAWMRDSGSYFSQNTGLGKNPQTTAMTPLDHRKTAHQYCGPNAGTEGPERGRECASLGGGAHLGTHHFPRMGGFTDHHHHLVKKGREKKNSRYFVDPHVSSSREIPNNRPQGDNAIAS